MPALLSNRRKYMTRRDPGGKIPLGDAVVTLDKDVWTYTGSAITPTPVVTLYGNLLAVNEDYTVGYTGNTEVGQGVVTVTGIGQYSGQRQKSFVIEAAPAPTEDFDISTAVQVGEAVRPFTSAQGCKLIGTAESGGSLNVFVSAFLSGSFVNNIVIAADDNGEYHLSGMGSSAASKTIDSELATYIRGFCVSNGGTMLFCSKNESYDSMKFGIGSGMNLASITALTAFDTSAFGVRPDSTATFITPDGMTLIVGRREATGYRAHLDAYALTTPHDVSTFSTTPVWSATLNDVTPGSTSMVEGLWFGNSGRTMLVSFNTTIYQFSLSTPYDARTATLTSRKTFNNPATGVLVLNGGKTLIRLTGSGYFTEWGMTS